MDHAVELWLSRLGPSRESCLRVFNRVYTAVVRDGRFNGSSPSDLVEFQANALGRDRYILGDLARAYINGLSLTLGSKQTYLSWFCSFFYHSHVPLPGDASFNFTNNKDGVVGKLDYDDFVGVVRGCNVLYKTVFMMMFEGLMGLKAISYVNLNHSELIVDAVTKNVGVFRVPLPSRKQNPDPYFTLLDTNGDWASSFKRYMKESSHDITKVLFVNKTGLAVSKADIRRYFHAMCVKQGLIKRFNVVCNRCHGETVRREIKVDAVRKIAYDCLHCRSRRLASEIHGLKQLMTSHRTGRNVHEIRDLASSRWGMSGADRTVREHAMGHSIKKQDPNKYEKIKYQPGFAEVEYHRAHRFLLVSEDATKVSRGQVDLELEGTKQTVELLQRQLAEERRVNEQRFREIKEWMERKATE